MARSPDPQRRAELLEAAVDYAVEHGLADLTLRPLAEALGVMPNTLAHHFGSKEELLSEILNGVRDRLRAMRAQLQRDPAQAPMEGVWEWISSDERMPFFRSFFEAYGLALRQPARYQPVPRARRRRLDRRPRARARDAGAGACCAACCSTC